MLHEDVVGIVAAICTTLDAALLMRLEGAASFD